MENITLEVIAERLENIGNQNKEDHEEMKAGIKHTNGDVGELKLWKAKATGAITILAIVMSGLVIPLIFKYLSISLFD